jgi:hypothetical protein
LRHYDNLDRDYPAIDGVSTAALLRAEDRAFHVRQLRALLAETERMHKLSEDSGPWAEWYADYMVDRVCPTCGLSGPTAETRDTIAHCPNCRRPVLSGVHIGVHGPYRG